MASLCLLQVRMDWTMCIKVNRVESTDMSLEVQFTPGTCLAALSIRTDRISIRSAATFSAGAQPADCDCVESNQGLGVSVFEMERCLFVFYFMLSVMYGADMYRLHTPPLTVV